MQHSKIRRVFSFMENSAMVGVVIFVGLFLLAAFASGSGTVKRLPIVPVDTKFQVTAEIVELKPESPVLDENSFRSTLDDIPKRREVARAILAEKQVPGELVYSRTTEILKQGGNFPISFAMPKETDERSGESSYLRSVPQKFIFFPWILWGRRSATWTVSPNGTVYLARIWVEALSDMDVLT